MDNSFCKSLIGLSESQAKQMIEAAGMVARVVHRDGEDIIVTMDLDPYRINLDINAGKVTDASIG